MCTDVSFCVEMWIGVATKGSVAWCRSKNRQYHVWMVGIIMNIYNVEMLSL